MHFHRIMLLRKWSEQIPVASPVSEQGSYRASCVSACAHCLLHCHWAPLKIACLYLYICTRYIKISLLTGLSRLRLIPKCCLCLSLWHEMHQLYCLQQITTSFSISQDHHWTKSPTKKNWLLNGNAYFSVKKKKKSI